MQGAPRRCSARLAGFLLPFVVAACATNVGGGPPSGSGGSSGNAGTTGTAGSGGATGSAGTTGAAGTPGAAGTTGNAGATGAAGTTRVAGTTGAAGVTGSAGTTGTAGVAGTAGRGGTTGSAGTTGAAGTIGAAGTTGVAGTTGAAGTGSTVDGGAAPVDLNGKRVLYVVDDPSSIDTGDAILQQVLQERGMIVTFAPSTGPASLATGQNLVLVSSGASASTWAPIFKDVTVPLMVFGNSAYTNLGWVASSGKGSVNSTTLCSLVDTSTTLDSDVMAGVGFKMILDIRSTSLYYGTPGGAPIKVASVMGAATQLVVFAFEKGAALATGTAAARRVGFGVKTDSVQDLTIEGFKLLTAAVEWTAGSN
jgi:hypothetical protein